MKLKSASLMTILLLSLITYFMAFEVEIVNAQVYLSTVFPDIGDFADNNFPLTRGGAARRSFIHGSYAYVFFCNFSDGVNFNVIYSSSNDYTTWSQPTTGNPACTHDERGGDDWAYQLDVFYNGTYCYLALANQTANEPILLKRGTPSNGEITWGSWTTVASGVSDEAPEFVSMTQTTDGYFWVAYTSRNTTKNRPDVYCVKSSSVHDETSWASRDEIYDTTATTSFKNCGVFPLSSTEVYVIYLHNYYLYGKTYDGTTIGSEEPITDVQMNNDRGWSACSNGLYNICVIWQATWINRTILFRYRTASWQDRVNFPSTLVEPVSGDYNGFYLDGTSGSTIYIFYNEEDINKTPYTFYYFCYTTWSPTAGFGDENVLTTESEEMESNYHQEIACSYEIGAGIFIGLWFDTSDDPECPMRAGITDDELQFTLRVSSNPEITADFTWNETAYETAYTANITSGVHNFTATETTAIRDSGENIYGFSHWMITNSSGSFNITQATIQPDIQEDHNLTLFYDNSYIITVTSTPYTSASFTATGYSHTCPKTLTRNNGSHTFVCSPLEYPTSATYQYVFYYWLVNGTTSYYSSRITLTIGGDTNLTLVLQGQAILSPYYPTFYHDIINGTWYMRSDTHTIHEQLAYRLDEINTQVSANTTRTTAATEDVSYGIRVYVYDIFGTAYEISSGVTAIVTRTSDGQGYQTGYFTCPSYVGMIDAVQVNVYQRFGSGSWVLRRYFISDENLYIKLPASTWEVIYYTNRTTASTTSYFYHGSSIHASLINYQYYRANPWEVALARLQAQDYFGWTFTPWTWWIGDIFWALALLFFVVTSYNRQGSLKPIINWLWILGGAGSFLSALLPHVVLRFAWLMLAVAFSITLFRLVYK